jgi:hypothetical protein
MGNPLWIERRDKADEQLRHKSTALQAIAPPILLPQDGGNIHKVAFRCEGCPNREPSLLHQ